MQPGHKNEIPFLPLGLFSSFWPGLLVPMEFSSFAVLTQWMHSTCQQEGLGRGVANSSSSRGLPNAPYVEIKFKNLTGFFLGGILQQRYR